VLSEYKTASDQTTKLTHNTHRQLVRRNSRYISGSIRIIRLCQPSTHLQCTFFILFHIWTKLNVHTI